MVGWHKRMKEHVINGSGGLSVAFFRTLFDNLQQNDIDLAPYDRLPKEFLPGRYAQQIQMELAFTSLLCMEKVILHDPGVSTGRQLSFSNSKSKLQLSKAHAKHDAKYKNKYRGGRKDWPKVHATFVKAWDNRLQNLYIDMNDIGEESTSSDDRHDEGIPTGTASQGTSLFQDNVQGRSEHSPLNSSSSSSQGIRTEQSHFDSTISPSVQGDTYMLDIRTEIMDEEVIPQVNAQETPIQEQGESMEQQPTYEEVTAHGTQMIQERAEQNESMEWQPMHEEVIARGTLLTRERAEQSESMQEQSLDSMQEQGVTLVRASKRRKIVSNNVDTTNMISHESMQEQGLTLMRAKNRKLVSSESMQVERVVKRPRFPRISNWLKGTALLLFVMIKATE
ncbi:titin-like protein [Corchorus capsularis]|uniref:Titin-like protein n=1 Tax=Corchorus capsularis TaxID=210143 RepID=A0A1R3GMQ3_COCAP|nr:titin-like protein [Corchorus capsularis]